MPYQGVFMLRHKFLMSLSLICLIGMFVVMPVAAQALPSGNEILARLAPRSGTGLLLDLLLYSLFGIGFITMILVPDKQMLPSLLMLGVIMAALIAKLQYVNINRCDMPTLFINIAMFCIPLIVAGMVRGRPGKTPKALWPAVLTGIIGAMYFFLYWLTNQQDCPFVCPHCLSSPS